MKNLSNEHKPSGKELRTAAVAITSWLLVIVLGMLCSCRVQAQSITARDLQASVCRITNQQRGVNDVGSGTLIDKTSDGREGLVLTCAHLFREGVGEVLVRFANGKSHQAKLIDIDQQADLAALAIAQPQGEPVEVAWNVQGKLHACGYGPRGIYRCAIGPAVGQVASAGQISLLVGDPVRSGDSGGGVFDERGRLVAVIWGESQGVTYASYGQPLRNFLERVLRRQATTTFSCANGACRQRPRVPFFPTRQTPATVDSRWDVFQRKVQKQLDELRQQKQDRGDYLLRSELPNFGNYAQREEVERLDAESTARHASLLDRLQTLDGRSAGKAVGTAAVSLLGLSGPAGWAVVGAASVGGWLIGRRMKRKLRGAGGRRRRRFQGKG